MYPIRENLGKHQDAELCDDGLRIHGPFGFIRFDNKELENLLVFLNENMKDTCESETDGYYYDIIDRCESIDGDDVIGGLYSDEYLQD